MSVASVAKTRRGQSVGLFVRLSAGQWLCQRFSFAVLFAVKHLVTGTRARHTPHTGAFDLAISATRLRAVHSLPGIQSDAGRFRGTAPRLARTAQWRRPSSTTKPRRFLTYGGTFFWKDFVEDPTRSGPTANTHSSKPSTHNSLRRSPRQCSWSITISSTTVPLLYVF